MALKPLDTFFNPTLRLPVTSGKTYEIQPVDADTGVWVTAVMGISSRAQLGNKEPTPDELARIVMDDEAQESMYKRLLGDVYDELIEDGHNWEVIKFVGTTAMIWVTAGLEAAEEYWNAGGDPKALKKKPQDRKRSAK